MKIRITGPYALLMTGVLTGIIASGMQDVLPKGIATGQAEILASVGIAGVFATILAGLILVRDRLRLGLCIIGLGIVLLGLAIILPALSRAKEASVNDESVVDDCPEVASTFVFTTFFSSTAKLQGVWAQHYTP